MMKKNLFMYISIILFVTLSTVLQVQAEDGVPENLYEELSLQEKKELITTTAIKYEIPPEILRAIALMETKMMQFDESGEPLITEDGGIGIMQITNTNIKDLDLERLKYDTAYNIEIGAKVLKEKWDLQKYGLLPTINTGDPKVIENWYFAVMAYNGLGKRNDPNTSEDTYQNRIFDYIEKYSGILLPDLPVVKTLINEKDIVTFSEKTMEWPEATTVSTQMFTEGDKVFTYHTNNPFYFNYANVREEANIKSAIVKKLPFYTNLEIVSGPYYDTNNEANQFVLYEVKGNGVTGFISSSNIRSEVMKDGNFTLWNDGKALQVPSEKEWSIYFNVALDGNSVHSRNIFVEDENGNGIFTVVTYDINDGVIKVKAPKEKYETGKTYTLKIKNIKSANHILMNTPIAMKFTIE